MTQYVVPYSLTVLQRFGILDDVTDAVNAGLSAYDKPTVSQTIHSLICYPLDCALRDYFTLVDRHLPFNGSYHGHEVIGSLTVTACNLQHIVTDAPICLLLDPRCLYAPLPLLLELERNTPPEPTIAVTSTMM